MILNKIEIRTLMTLSTGIEHDEHRTGTIYAQLAAKKLIVLGDDGVPELTEIGRNVIDHLLDRMIPFAPSYVPLFDTKLSATIYETASNITEHYKAIMRETGVDVDKD